MDPNLAVGLLGLVVSIVGMVAAILAAKYARRQLQVTAAENLQVRVNPTRKGARQMAQIRLFNCGQRPINVQAFVVAWGIPGHADESMAASIHESLPALLAEKQCLDFLAFVDDRPLEELTRIGAQDRTGRIWWADDDNMQVFLRVALQHAPPSPLGEPPSSGSEKTDEAVEVTASRICASGSHCPVLGITIQNKAQSTLEVKGIEVVWEYEPERFISGGDGKPTVIEHAGQIQIGKLSPTSVIAPGATGTCRISPEFNGLLCSAGAPDVPEDHIAVRVHTGSGRCWRASGDGVSDVIKALATELATLQ